MTVEDAVISLVATGLDKDGQIFRQRAAVLTLNAVECTFPSCREMQADSWVLLEIDDTKIGGKSSEVQGRVKSVRPAGTGDGLFQISVELETLPLVRTMPASAEGMPTGQETPAGGDMRVATEPPPRNEMSSPTRMPSHQAASSGDPSQQNSNQETPTVGHSGELSTSIPAHVRFMIRELAKSAVDQEVKQRWQALQDSLLSHSAEAAEGAVASRIEKSISDALDTQASHNQAAIQALQGDLLDQLVQRVAESEQLGNRMEDQVKGLSNQSTEVLRTSAAKVVQDLDTRLDAVRRSFEETAADMQTQLNTMRAQFESLMAAAQISEEKAAKAGQCAAEALERFEEADRSAAEKFNERLTGDAETRLAEFTRRLDTVVIERAASLAGDLEPHLASNLQRVDEKLQELAAGIQLAQISMRTEGQRLNDLSQSAAVKFEKEIQAFFRRLSGGTQSGE